MRDAEAGVLAGAWFQRQRLSACGAHTDNASFPVYAEDLSSAVAGSAPCATAAPSAAALSAAAAAAGVVLVGGSVPERDAAGRLYNTCLVFGTAGRVLAKHRKARQGCDADSERVHCGIC